MIEERMLNVMLFLLFSTIVLFPLILLLLKSFTNKKYLDNDDYVHRRNFERIYSPKFEKNESKKFVGVELECLRRKQNKEINDSFLESNNFIKGQDISIRGKGKGYELRSKPTNGDILYKQIDEVVREANRKEWYVNKSCGFHLHIEAEPDLDLIKKLYCFYSKYEDLFFQMLPESRQTNKFCEKFSSMDAYGWEKVLEVKNLKEFKKLFYELLWNYSRSKWEDHYYKKRYCWINFHSIFYRGTVEIRAHSGTLDVQKIKQWIKIHLRIRDFLEKTSIEKLKKMNISKKVFLRLFPMDVQDYIIQRWNAFPTINEDDFIKEENGNKYVCKKEGVKK